MTIDSGRGRPGPTWSHKLVSGRIPAIKRRLPEDDLRGAHPTVIKRLDHRVMSGDFAAYNLLIIKRKMFFIEELDQKYSSMFLIGCEGL